MIAATMYEPTPLAGLAGIRKLRLVPRGDRPPAWIEQLSPKQRARFDGLFERFDEALKDLRKSPDSVPARARAAVALVDVSEMVGRLTSSHDISAEDEVLLRAAGGDALQKAERLADDAVAPSLRGALALVSSPVSNADPRLLAHALSQVHLLGELARYISQAFSAYAECCALLYTISGTPGDPLSDQLLLNGVVDTFQVFRSHRRLALEMALRELTFAEQGWLPYSFVATVTVFSREGLPWLLRLLRDGDRVAAFARLWSTPDGRPYWLHHVGASAVDAVLDVVEQPGTHPGFDRSALRFLEEHPDDLAESAEARVEQLRRRLASVDEARPTTSPGERQGEIEQILSFARRREDITGLVHEAVGAVVRGDGKQGGEAPGVG